MGTLERLGRQLRGGWLVKGRDASGQAVEVGGTLPLLGFAFRRARLTWRLFAVSLFGLVVAVGLATAIPLYSYGALNRLLWQRVDTLSLIELPSDVVFIRSMVFFPKDDDLANYRRLDSFVSDHAANVVALPRRQLMRSVASDLLVIWPEGQDGQADRNLPQRRVTAAFQQNLMGQVRLVRGEGLVEGPSVESADVPAVVNVESLESLEVVVGERVFLAGLDPSSPAVPLRIVGAWQAKDPDDHLWRFSAASPASGIYVSEADYFGRIVPTFDNALNKQYWYAVYDQSRISSANSTRVLAGLEYLESQLKRTNTNARVETTLRRSLAIYERQATVLSTLMLVLSVPTVAVALYFVGVSARMLVERRRGEIALLKSRGASTTQVVAIYAVEAALLGLVALAVGLVVGVGVAQLVGQTYGFLQFTRRPPIVIGIGERVLEFAGVTALLALPALLLPTLGAARRSIVTYKQEIVRVEGRSILRRAPIEVLPLGAAAYGYHLLNQNQAILPLDKGESFVIDPLMVLTPALFVTGVALLLQRLYPLVVAALAVLAESLPGPTVGLALREIARSQAQHSALVLLLTLTLALGFYNATTAQTIDRNISDQVLYGLPADLEIWEYWPKLRPEGQAGGAEGPPSGEEGGESSEPGAYTMPPDERFDVPGLAAASPYRSYEVEAAIGRTSLHGSLLAIDRVKYARASWWRRDFAERPLGALLNALGANDRATLVSRSFLQRSGLLLGDAYTLTFEGKPVPFYVAEVVDYFPTLYPEKGPFFVANLEYVYDQIGITPYRSWVRVEPGARASSVVETLRDAGVGVEFVRDGRVLVADQRADAQRVGLFGSLTVGFVVALLLTVLGFLLYSFLSFEKRLIQLGILRAMGLSVRQLLMVLFAEQSALILLGILFGTALGLVTNHLFVPFLQVGSDGQTPPFVVQTAWTDLQRVYLALGCLLLVGLGATAWLVHRVRLYEVVKLGGDSAA